MFIVHSSLPTRRWTDACAAFQVHRLGQGHPELETFSIIDQPIVSSKQLESKTTVSIVVLDARLSEVSNIRDVCPEKWHATATDHVREAVEAN